MAVAPSACCSANQSATREAEQQRRHLVPARLVPADAGEHRGQAVAAQPAQHGRGVRLAADAGPDPREGTGRCGPVPVAEQQVDGTVVLLAEGRWVGLRGARGGQPAEHFVGRPQARQARRFDAVLEPDHGREAAHAEAAHHVVACGLSDAHGHGLRGQPLDHARVEPRRMVHAVAGDAEGGADEHDHRPPLVAARGEGLVQRALAERAGVTGRARRGDACVEAGEVRVVRVLDDAVAGDP
jgi:hypothetical protein